MAYVQDIECINSGYDYAKGDQSLRFMSSLFYDSIKKTDTTARIGSDKFALILETGDENVMYQILWRIQNKLDQENLKNGAPFILSFEYGYAFYDPENTRDMNDLFENAEQMMDQLKFNYDS